MIRAGLFFAIVLAAATPGLAQISAGYVVEIRGEWILNGSTPVKASQKVPAGGAIRRRSSSADDRIVITNLRGEKIPAASQDCRSRCSGVISLASGSTETAATQNKSYAMRIFDALTGASLLPSWTNRQARGGALSDGVILLEGDKIDIAPVIKREGEQLIKWRRITAESSSWTEPVRLSNTILSGFTTGLFELTIVRSNGADFEPVASSWILVAPKEKYGTNLAAFDEMKKLTAAWGDSVTAETRRSYLQGSLRAIELGIE